MPACVIATHGAGAYKTYFENNWDITSVETVDANSLNISVFPNPTANYFTMKFDSPGNEKVQVRVLNSTGQVVRSQFITTLLGANETQVDISNLSSGMYYATLYTNQGNFTKAINKQ